MPDGNLVCLPSLTDETSDVVRSIVGVEVIIVVVLAAAEGRIGVAASLIGRRLPLVAESIGFLRRRVHGCGHHPGSPAPHLALAGDEVGGARQLSDANVDELVAEAAPA